MSATLHAPPAGAASASAPRKARDPWFDNAKMALVTLVVVGHTWTLLPENRLDSWLYDFLYLWHVPAFVMITGYLSRSFTWSRRNICRLLSTVALPYLIFEAALAGFRTGVGGEHFDRLFIDPHWPMWYLATLFLWRLATPLFRRTRLALPAAVLICVVGGLTTGDVLDTERAMGLLPFFVIGLSARPEHLDLLRRTAVRRAALLTMAGGAAVATLYGSSLSTEWLYWRSSYAELGTSFGTGVVIRLGLLGVSTLLAIAFFALVPRGGRRFSALGAATLVVYLFHGFVVKAAVYADFPGWAAEHPLTSLPLSTAAAIGVAIILAWPPVARRLGIATDPVGAWNRHLASRRDDRGGRPGQFRYVPKSKSSSGTA